MAEKLAQHKHCINCRKAVAPSRDFCGDECKAAHTEMINKKRRQLFLLFGMAVAVLILTMIMGYG